MASVERQVLVKSRRIQMEKIVGGTDTQRVASVGGPVSVTVVSRVCSVTMVALVACTPSDTGGYPAFYQCGVASTQCGGIGLLGAGIPLYQARYWRFPSRCTTPIIGSLVTPSVCLGTSPLCLPAPVCMMCDVSTCGEEIQNSEWMFQSP